MNNGETEQRTDSDKGLGEKGQRSNKVEFLLAVAGNIVGLGKRLVIHRALFKKREGEDARES